MKPRSSSDFGLFLSNEADLPFLLPLCLSICLALVLAFLALGLAFKGSASRLRAQRTVLKS